MADYTRISTNSPANRHSVESDEAYARQLQAQEMGIRVADTNTPLIRQDNENPTVINARLNELSSARIALGAIVLMNFPQVLAACIILFIHWDDASPCDNPRRDRWKWWSMVSAIRMSLFTITILSIHLMRTQRFDMPRVLANLTSSKNLLDILGLIWFVVGNMWVFGDNTGHCSNPTSSPIYNLCVAMLVINYIQICFPCIIAILLIPVFCFCMPCLIRILARMQAANAPKGASDAAIDSVPQYTVNSETFPSGKDSMCPICLSEMALGESVRLLPCKHLFHSQCVDEWLKVNASCPTCRSSIFIEDSSSSESKNSNSNEEKTSTLPNNRRLPLETTADRL